MRATGTGGTFDTDQRRRNRNFTLTMAALLVLFALAALVYFQWHQTWLAVVFLALWLPGRWAATLLADANPPARRTTHARNPRPRPGTRDHQ